MTEVLSKPRGKLQKYATPLRTKDKVEKILRYTKYLSDSNEVVQSFQEMLEEEGLHLSIGETGAGKSYLICKTIKELSQRHKDTIYILAVPNRVQAQQIEKSYGIQALVGGTNLNSKPRVFVMVYDMFKTALEYAIIQGMKVVLIIDEAHQLIDAQFRGKALAGLNELSKLAITTVHLTATPRKILSLYQYNKIYKAMPIENNNNISTHRLMIIEKDSEARLIDICKDLKDQNYKSFIFINNSDNISNMYMILTMKGYKVGVLHSDYKDNDVFTSVSSTDMLPKEYDVFLSTSVCECGLNILNEDIALINYLPKSNYFDADSLAQQSARFRNKINLAITIITRKVKPIKLLSLKKIDDEYNSQINKAILQAQKLHEVFEAIGCNADEEVNNWLNSRDSLYHSNGCGCLYAENGEIKINEEIAIKQKYMKYDRQYCYVPLAFNEILRGLIKADNFEMENYNKRISWGTKKSIKSAEQERKIEKKELEQLALATLESLQGAHNIVIEDEDNNFTFEPIENKDCPFMEQQQQQEPIKWSELSLLSEYLTSKLDVWNKFPQELKDKIKILNEQEKILNNIRLMLKININIEDSVEQVIKAYKKKKSSETKEYINDFIREVQFKRLNKLYDKKHEVLKKYNITKKIFDEYHLTRKIFDIVLDKRGRISKEKLLELYEMLLQYKHIKSDKNDSIEEKKLSTATTNQLLKTISMIYSLTKDKKGYLINSLQK